MRNWPAHHQLIVCYKSVGIQRSKGCPMTYGVMGMADRCREPKALPGLGLPEVGGLPSLGLDPLPELETSLRNCSLFILAIAAKRLLCAGLSPSLRWSGKHGSLSQTRDDARLQPMILYRAPLHLTRHVASTVVTASCFHVLQLEPVAHRKYPMLPAHIMCLDLLRRFSGAM